MNTRTVNDTPSLARQRWLEDATVALRKLFDAKGYTVPPKVRVSVGWPKGGRKRIGECWGDASSSDKHFELFVSPEITTARNTLRVLDVLAHELAHAVVGTKEGHGAVFKRCALAIGLAGKMTATTAGPDFTAWAKGVVERIGEVPAGALALVAREKKQSTRLLKCECSDCGYTVRTTRKWVEASGAPICPTDLVSMACDAIDAEDSEDE